MMRWDILYNPWVDLYRYHGGLVATYNKYGNKKSHINISIKPHIRGWFVITKKLYNNGC